MNRCNAHGRRSQTQAAFTLLELMLALALLGALMTVAWSLMGTFRDAEQRGWKLSHRVQTIRVARQWIQSDMQQLVQSEIAPATANVRKSRLNGNSLGFKASIAPSIDPLPFLEDLMSNPTEGLNALTTAIADEPVANLYSDTEAIVDQAKQSLWPAETMEVQYELTPIEDSSTTAEAALLQPMDLSDVQFTLTRREMFDGSAVQTNQNSGRSSQTNNLADRVLTAQDLYRQTDETTEPSGVAIRETQLDGLTNVQFQYFDGISWKREWNSDQTGGLPKAIALCFDFPATVDMKRPEPQPTSSGIEDGLTDPGDLLASNPISSGMSFADSALAAEPTVESSTAGSESSLMQAATHEVQIVVYVGGQAASQGSSPSLGPQRRSRARGGFE